LKAIGKYHFVSEQLNSIYFAWGGGEEDSSFTDIKVMGQKNMDIEIEIIQRKLSKID